MKIYEKIYEKYMKNKEKYVSGGAGWGIAAGPPHYFGSPAGGSRGEAWLCIIFFILLHYFCFLFLLFFFYFFFYFFKKMSSKYIWKIKEHIWKINDKYVKNSAAVGAPARHYFAALFSGRRREARGDKRFWHYFAALFSGTGNR